MRSRYAGAGAVKLRRSFIATNIQGNDAYAPYIPPGAVSGVHSYKLEDVVNSTDFKNLFEEYCITGVKISFHLRRAPNTSTTGAQSTYPTLFFSVDYDGSGTLPTSLNEMLEKSTLQRRLLDPQRPVNIFIRNPRVANLAFQSALVSGYTTAGPQQWLSTTYDKVPHYGMSWVIDEHRNSSNYIDVVTTYYMKFRGTN